MNLIKKYIKENFDRCPSLYTNKLTIINEKLLMRLLNIKEKNKMHLYYDSHPNHCIELINRDMLTKKGRKYVNNISCCHKSDCSDCWFEFLIDLDVYVDKNADLPAFLRHKNKKIPSFLQKNKMR